MKLTTRLALALATLATTAAPLVAQAADRPSPFPTTASRPRPASAATFTTVHRTRFRAQAIASPATGTVVVAGVASRGESRIMVDVMHGGRWATTALPASAQQVRMASAAGTTWLLGIGATPSLWRTDEAGGLARVTLPPMPAGDVRGFEPHGIAAEGGTVALWGFGTLPDHREGAVATLSQGRWSVRSRLFGPGAVGGPSPEALTALVGGHLLAETGFLGSRPSAQLADYATSPATLLGLTWMEGPDGYAWRSADLVARSVSDVTSWGGYVGTDHQRGVVRRGGLCHVVRPGFGSGCPAPAWSVSAAARLADGRTVLGGADTVTATDVSTQADGPVVPGGYALVSAPGAPPTPLPGDPGDGVGDLAVEPAGLTAWSIAGSGYATVVQRAVLPPARTTGARTVTVR